MKKILILILFLLVTNNASSSNIVYLDVQFIIDNSDIGIFYKNKIKKIQENNKQILKPSEEKIKKTDKEKLNDSVPYRFYDEIVLEYDNNESLLEGNSLTYAEGEIEKDVTIFLDPLSNKKLKMVYNIKNTSSLYK